MTDLKVLERGDQVPHFEVTTVSGTVFRYATIWQRKNLLLVVVPASGPGGGYVSELSARATELQRLETVCVVTRDSVPGLRAPAVLLADRWGAIVHITAVSESGRSPGTEDLFAWLEYIQHRCPECEGEAR